jgi:hypothetical protein
LVFALRANRPPPASRCSFRFPPGLDEEGRPPRCAGLPSSTCQVNLMGQPRRVRVGPGAGRGRMVRGKADQAGGDDFRERGGELSRRREEGNVGRGETSSEIERGGVRRRSGLVRFGCLGYRVLVVKALLVAVAGLVSVPPLELRCEVPLVALRLRVVGRRRRRPGTPRPAPACAAVTERARLPRIRFAGPSRQRKGRRTPGGASTLAGASG